MRIDRIDNGHEQKKDDDYKLLKAEAALIGRGAIQLFSPFIISTIIAK